MLCTFLRSTFLQKIRSSAEYPTFSLVVQLLCDLGWAITPVMRDLIFEHPLLRHATKNGFLLIILLWLLTVY